MRLRSEAMSACGLSAGAGAAAGPDTDAPSRAELGDPVIGTSAARATRSAHRRNAGCRVRRPSRVDRSRAKYGEIQRAWRKDFPVCHSISSHILPVEIPGLRRSPRRRGPAERADRAISWPSRRRGPRSIQDASIRRAARRLADPSPGEDDPTGARPAAGRCRARGRLRPRGRSSRRGSDGDGWSGRCRWHRRPSRFPARPRRSCRPRSGRRWRRR